MSTGKHDASEIDDILNRLRTRLENGERYFLMTASPAPDAAAIDYTCESDLNDAGLDLLMIGLVQRYNRGELLKEKH